MPVWDAVPRTSSPITASGWGHRKRVCQGVVDTQTPAQHGHTPSVQAGTWVAAGNAEVLVTVLGEYIDHHVQEEQDEMLRKCRRADMDHAELATELAARKSELMAELAETAE